MGGDTSHHDERTRVDRIRGEVRKDSLLHGDCVSVLAWGTSHSTPCMARVFSVPGR
jgi:hypothetical protein